MELWRPLLCFYFSEKLNWSYKVHRYGHSSTCPLSLVQTEIGARPKPDLMWGVKSDMTVLTYSCWLVCIWAKRINIKMRSLSAVSCGKWIIQTKLREADLRRIKLQVKTSLATLAWWPSWTCIFIFYFIFFDQARSWAPVITVLVLFVNLVYKI